MSLSSYLRRFFDGVRSAKIERPSERDLVDGKAFSIKHYPLGKTVCTLPGDTMTGKIIEQNEVIAEISEPIGESLRINTISMIRFNDALGYKHAVGAIFGER